jgi:hypothetical protein
MACSCGKSKAVALPPPVEYRTEVWGETNARIATRERVSIWTPQRQFILGTGQTTVITTEQANDLIAQGAQLWIL